MSLVGYIVEKKITKRYEIVSAMPFLKYGTFQPARKKIGLDAPKTCFLCGHKFTDDDFLYLGVVKGDKNRILCDYCGKLVESYIEKKNNKTEETSCTK